MVCEIWLKATIANVYHVSSSTNVSFHLSPYFVILSTLEYLISVWWRLLIFEQNSTHVLIPYHMFISFGKLLLSTSKIMLQNQFLIVNFENIDMIFFENSTQYGYSITICLLVFTIFHPIWLFHTICLLDTQEYADFYRNSDWSVEISVCISFLLNFQERKISQCWEPEEMESSSQKQDHERKC